MDPSVLFPTLAEDELRDLKDALAELLDRGSVLGFESRSRDLYQRASGATLGEPLRAVLALLEMELVNDDRRLLLFARPLDNCQLLRRFNQVESLFVLALWRIYHEHYQQGRVGAVVLGLNDLYAKLRSYFPRLLQETPKPGFFRSILAPLQRRNLVRWSENADSFGLSECQILPTVLYVIPFGGLEDWLTQAARFSETPASEPEPTTDEIPES